ncbi:heme binding [Naganishia adeliensis]|uniref:Heme binding n=1 Tax=Naganishia adeliensis TaxID=92952 RepID=A0ACC2X3T8_9TREE|nr:heme binding [Naganishia adeliensis]
MVQGGDPTGTGRGGTSIYGEKLQVPQHLQLLDVELTGASFLHRSADEIHPELRFVGAGILAMANSGPNTNGTNSSLPSRDSLAKLTSFIPHLGSQFFLTLAPTPFLDGKHTIFGRVHSGMPTLQRLAAVRTDGNDKPVEEIKIHKARIGQGLAPSSEIVQT